MKRLIGLLVFFACCDWAGSVAATTWDEPWTEEVIHRADSFSEIHVTSSGEGEAVSANVMRTLAGKELPNKIQLKGFYLLNLTSYSGGEGPSYHFENGQQLFCFLKKSKE